MWIRSQDKNFLINVIAITRDRDNRIFGWISSGDYFDMGQYSTEEALDVIGEIESIIASDGELNDRIFRVYQMPKERDLNKW